MRNFMKKVLLQLCIFTQLLGVTPQAFGGVDLSNQFKLGNGSTGNKLFILNRGANNPQIRWSESGSVLQYSNNGSTFKTFNLGTDINSGAATSGQVATADGAGGTTWQTPLTTLDDGNDLTNLAISATVGSNALTIALKDKAGSDPSAGSPVKIGFRSSTVTSGVYNLRSVTGALSVVVSNGSSLGSASGTATTYYVYALDNSGTVELAVSLRLFDEGSRASTTAEGGAGGADTNNVMYSTTARTNVPIRLIGRIVATEATAGVWASAPSEVSRQPFFNGKVYFRATVANTLTCTTSNTCLWSDSTATQSDTMNAFDGTSTVGKYTVAKAGLYNACVRMTIDSTTATGSAQAWLYKNGTIFSSISLTSKLSATSALAGLAGCDIMPVAVGDYIQIYFRNDMNASLNVINDANESFWSLSEQ